MKTKPSQELLMSEILEASGPKFGAYRIHTLFTAASS